MHKAQYRSGRIIALRAALSLPVIQKIAVYEAPLVTDHASPMAGVLSTR
jgi:hypothetical protein